MTTAEYDDIADHLLSAAHEIETGKRPAYTIGSPDVLANFKSIADRTGATPGQVLTVYLLKHIDAITAALCQPGIPQAESVESRFADAVNYLKLGYALVVERQARDVAVSPDPADPVVVARAAPPDRDATPRHRAIADPSGDPYGAVS